MFTFLLFGGVPLILLPPKITSPLSGSTKPPMMRRVVVLPQPDGPRIVTNSRAVFCADYTVVKIF